MPTCSPTSSGRSRPATGRPDGPAATSTVTPNADAPRAEHERLGLPLRSVRLTYGVTTVDDAERSTFRTRLRPFEGLDKPEATESD